VRHPGPPNPFQGRRVAAAVLALNGA